jgi:hypothetical protein
MFAIADVRHMGLYIVRACNRTEPNHRSHGEDSKLDAHVRFPSDISGDFSNAGSRRREKAISLT